MEPEKWSVTVWEALVSRGSSPVTGAQLYLSMCFPPLPGVPEDAASPGHTILPQSRQCSRIMRWWLL